MVTAKIFDNGSSQAVSLPDEFRFTGSEVYIRKIGDSVILVPKDKAWETFMESIDTFTDDYFTVMESRMNDDVQSERESL